MAVCKTAQHTNHRPSVLPDLDKHS
jgi:hypothetical protein